MLAAIKIELAWYRMTENIVSQMLPDAAEPEFLNVKEGVDQHKVVPPPRADSESDLSLAAQLHNESTRSSQRGAAQGGKWGSDPADRASVQALQSDVRQLLSAMTEMQQAQQSVQDQLRALATTGRGSESPRDGPDSASSGKQQKYI